MPRSCLCYTALVISQTCYCLSGPYAVVKLYGHRRVLTPAMPGQFVYMTVCVAGVCGRPNLAAHVCIWCLLHAGLPNLKCRRLAAKQTAGYVAHSLSSVCTMVVPGERQRGPRRASRYCPAGAWRLTWCSMCDLKSQNGAVVTFHLHFLPLETGLLQGMPK